MQLFSRLTLFENENCWEYARKVQMFMCMRPVYIKNIIYVLFQ